MLLIHVLGEQNFLRGHQKLFLEEITGDLNFLLGLALAEASVQKPQGKVASWKEEGRDRTFLCPHLDQKSVKTRWAKLENHS